MINTVTISSQDTPSFPGKPVYGMVLLPRESSALFSRSPRSLLVIYNAEGLYSIGLVSLEKPNETWEWTKIWQDEWDCSGFKLLPPGTLIKYQIGDWKNES